MKFQKMRFVMALFTLIIGQSFIMAQDGDEEYSQLQNGNYSTTPQDDSSSSQPQPQPQYGYPEEGYPSQYPENDLPRDEARRAMRENAQGGESRQQYPEGGRAGGESRRR